MATIGEISEGHIDRQVESMGHVYPGKDEVFTTVRSNSESGNDSDHDLEKSGVATYVGEVVVDERMEGEPIMDPFVPFDDLPEERRRIITIRALLLGSICGALVNASNVYLGLKTGWTFGANLFGAIIGFSVLKALAKSLPENFPIFGGSFGPRENNIVQTAATAAGGLSSVFISGIPALYQLGLLDTPQKDFGRLIPLTIIGGYFGFAFATPLRKFFLIYVARELKLVFPTPTATATTIRSMHLAVTGETVARAKMFALSMAFSAAFLLRVVSQYAIGILWDWHIFTWFFIWGGYKNQALAVENWGWYIEWTPAFIGSGMLVGLNTSLSFFGGSVLAWGIIGPALVHNGAAFGKQPFAGDPDLGERWGGYTIFGSLSGHASSKATPSPRFWLLWPGVLTMIVVSFVELGLQYKIFYFVSKAIWRASAASLGSGLRKMGKPSKFFEKHGAREHDADLVEDICDESDLVSWWMWLPLLVVVIICGCVVMGVQYGMPIGMSLLSIFLAFFFSFLAVQCTGVTDITPLTAASKASQIVLGGATKGEHWAVDHAQRLNLLGGSLASMGANQASDLVGDFRVGFLLRTSPRQQWAAQGICTLVAVFLAPALFVLFVKAYPCIIDINAETCPFGAPSVAAWRAVAVAVTDPTFPVPTSSGIFSVCMAAFGGVMILVRQYAYTGTWAKYRAYHPNMMCVALAFVLPQTVYGTAMVIGAVPAYFWARRNPKSFDLYGFAIAAGLIAGEGIGGVVNAIFQVAGIAGPDPYGTQVGCPAESC